MKKEYLKPDIELVSFSTDEELMSEIDGSIWYTEPEEGWE